jgi:hypothetical protein
MKSTNYIILSVASITLMILSTNHQMHHIDCQIQEIEMERNADYSISLKEFDSCQKHFVNEEDDFTMCNDRMYLSNHKDFYCEK